MSWFRKKQNGFSLLEVLLAVTIAIALGSLHLGQVRRNTESMQATAVGEQLKMVGQGLNNYLSLRYDKLITLSSVSGAGTADDPGPRNCDIATGICTITAETLRRNGLLPNSFSGRNAYGATYEFYIRVQGTAPNQQVDGLVITNTPYTVGGSPRYDLIGQAMLVAGADSGSTRTLPTRVDGLNGGWQETGFPVNQIGLIGYRVGYGTAGWSSFLRIDGSNAMVDDLQMGGHDIVDVDNIYAAGDVEADRFIAVEGNDSILIGNQTLPTRVRIGATGGAVTIDAPSGVSFVNTISGTPVAVPFLAGDSTLGSISSSGSGEFDGHLESASFSTPGNISSGGEISSNGRIYSGGNFETVDGSFISANGNITIGGSISSAGSLSAAGATLTANSLNFVRGGGWFMSDNDFIRAQGNKGISTTGEIRSGPIRADGLITARSNIQLDSVAAVGASCPQVGRISRDTSGRVLNCVGGRWESAGGIKNSTQINGGAGTTSVATCPAGYKLSGGGHIMGSRPTVNDGFGPAQSYGNPNASGGRGSWTVISGSATTFQAVAYCVN